MRDATLGSECVAIVLTRGDRPAQLARSLASICDQRNPAVEPLVVWNGVPVSPSFGGSASQVVEKNLGIPGGRNFGAASTEAPFILFLDDDAHLLSTDVAEKALARFSEDPDLAVVALHIVDPQGETSPRHVPRLGGRSADRSGPVTAFLGGACVVRRSAWQSVGGYASEFFYAMEETDVSWRLIDAGWSIWYAADQRVEHPRTEPSRHGEAIVRTARNRVWTAQRNLPGPLVPLYLGLWVLIGLARALKAREVPRDLLLGYRSGLRDRLGPRAPMKWSTVWRLTRLGRPPIV